MTNTSVSGDSGATESAKQAGTAATKGKKAGKPADEFKPVTLKRERDGQERTATTPADLVRAKFDGFVESK